MASRVFRLGAFGFGLFGTFMAGGGIAGNYYSSRRKDPGPHEFLAWALVFGATERLAAVMPAASGLRRGHGRGRRGRPALRGQRDRLCPAGHAAAQRGLALSAYNAGFIGFVPAGAFAAAAIASVAGIRWALIGPGLAILVCGAALTRSFGRKGTPA